MQLAFLLIVLIYLSTHSAPAWAYLDPSTGSMVISAIVGLFASLALGLKTYWYKFKRLFRRAKPSPDETPIGKAD